MYNKKTCHNAETNMSPRKRQKKYKKNQILSVVMAIACTVVTPASDVALSMALMTQNVYAENIQTTFPDGWNKDDKDDKNNTGPGNTGTENNGNETGGGSGGASGELGAAESPTPTPTLGAVESPTPTPTAKEKKAMESIMPGLSKFDFQAYKWPGSVSVGTLAYSMAESLYTMRNSETKKPLLWNNDDDVTQDMKNFYSSTNWNNFEGMYETIEISNFCQAVLSDEVKQFEDLMDAAAEKYGFKPYKEIFKAIAQARFNEYKDNYATAKAIKGNEVEKEVTTTDKKGNTTTKKTGNPDFKFDLFHINGSWLARAENGDETPVGSLVAPTASPMPTPLPWDDISGTPVPPPATPWPDADEESEAQKKWHRDNGSCYTVADSIDIAAQAFSRIIQDACYPSPYSTETLMSAVQGFEFGGDSEAIKNRFSTTSTKLSGFTKFVTFTSYCDQQSMASKKQEEESSSDEEVDYDSIIKRYAKVIADGAKRTDEGKEKKDDKYGEYKYSDQFFYQKVFENYKCTGGGSMDYGELPESMKEILRKCMQTWDSRVTKERREIIQQGVLLYGVTYSMGLNGDPPRNSPSPENPKYLDCSSFVGQCYWRAGVLGRNAIGWCTGDFASSSNQMKQISEDELIPGDMGQLYWHPGGSGAREHIGIFIGKVDGQSYYIHCTGSSPEAPGVKHPPGKGIVISAPGYFKAFGRYMGLK